MFIYTLFTHPLTFVGYIATIALSITLHELAHGYAALSQGDDTPQTTGHMTLNPVVHMGWESIVFLCVTGMAWGQMPVNPYKFRRGNLSSALVAIAGPFCNLAVSLVFMLLLRLNAGSIPAANLSTNVFYLAAHINLILFMFNLMPLPPLDGFHVLSEAFPALQILRDNPLSLVPLMILLMNPSYASGVIAAADLAIELMSGYPSIAF